MCLSWLESLCLNVIELSFSPDTGITLYMWLPVFTKFNYCRDGEQGYGMTWVDNMV